MWVPDDERSVADALALLLKDHRVLVASGRVVAPPGAAVFASDSGDPGDVAEAMRALEGRGRLAAIDWYPLPVLGLYARRTGLPRVHH